jgi:hypothetical protein
VAGDDGLPAEYSGLALGPGGVPGPRWLARGSMGGCASATYSGSPVRAVR